MSSGPARSPGRRRGRVPAPPPAPRPALARPPCPCPQPWAPVPVRGSERPWARGPPVGAVRAPGGGLFSPRSGPLRPRSPASRGVCGPHVLPEASAPRTENSQGGRPVTAALVGRRVGGDVQSRGLFLSASGPVGSLEAALTRLREGRAAPSRPPRSGGARGGKQRCEECEGEVRPWVSPEERSVSAGPPVPLPRRCSETCVAPSWPVQFVPVGRAEGEPGLPPSGQRDAPWASCRDETRRRSSLEGTAWQLLVRADPAPQTRAQALRLLPRRSDLGLDP